MNSKELLEECAYHIYISEFDDEGIQKILILQKINVLMMSMTLKK